MNKFTNFIDFGLLLSTDFRLSFDAISNHPSEWLSDFFSVVEIINYHEKEKKIA